MKKQNLILSFAAIIMGFFLIAEISSCTHDDEIFEPIGGSTFEYGGDIVKVSDGYNFDKTHSSVRWETAYLASSALLTGRFNSFEGEIEFIENEPENISFSGRVVLSSVNTGEPGRDQGCLKGTFGIVDGDDTTDEALLVSKSVSFDNNGGYNCKADLTFHGVTSEVDVKLIYSGTTLFEEGSGVFGAPLNLAGFTAEFQFNAKTVFGIESGNIADLLTVKINMQLKQPQ
jgi:polyisoprenoid-binding protein YceI